jgi:predicted peroxiredoxin
MTRDTKFMIVLTTGPEDGGARATLAFALAVSLQAMGNDVALYLNNRAAHWAQKNSTEHIQIKGFDSLNTYISHFLEAEGQLYFCASCLEDLPGGDASLESVMRAGVTPAGVTTLASLMLERKTLSM